jgi:hypothetical protein
MGLRRDIAVYFGLADEPAESRQAREAALLQTSTARLVLNGLLGVLVAAAVVGLIRCILDGETVTLGRVIEKGWLLAVVLTIVGVARALWDLRRAKRELDAARGP